MNTLLSCPSLPLQRIIKISVQIPSFHRWSGPLQPCAVMTSIQGGKHLQGWGSVPFPSPGEQFSALHQQIRKEEVNDLSVPRVWPKIDRSLSQERTGTRCLSAAGQPHLAAEGRCFGVQVFGADACLTYVFWRMGNWAVAACRADKDR